MCAAGDAIAVGAALASATLPGITSAVTCGPGEATLSAATASAVVAIAAGCLIIPASSWHTADVACAAAASGAADGGGSTATAARGDSVVAAADVAGTDAVASGAAADVDHVASAVIRPPFDVICVAAAVACASVALVGAPSMAAAPSASANTAALTWLTLADQVLQLKIKRWLLAAIFSPLKAPGT